MAQVDDILSTLKDYERRIRNLETSPQPPNINAISASQGAFTLSAGAIQWFSVRINSTDNFKMMAVPSIAIYKNSVSAANRYPDGANWTGADLGTFVPYVFLDPSLSDGNDEQFRVVFINFNASPIDLTFQVAFRYLLKGTT